MTKRQIQSLSSKRNGSTMSTLLVIFLGLATTVLTEEMKFTYTLPDRQNICFFQNLAENIQAVIEVTSQSSQLALSVNDPKGKQLEMQENNQKLRYTFTAFTGGSYQMCVTNKDSSTQDFEFMILLIFISIDKKQHIIQLPKLIQTGVEAKDYTNIITKKHLKPIEVQAQKVQDMVKQLRQELSYLVMNEEQLKEQNQKIKSLFSPFKFQKYCEKLYESRVFIFGVISIIVMAASTYLQITYLKNFFRYKKII